MIEKVSSRIRQLQVREMPEKHVKYKEPKDKRGIHLTGKEKKKDYEYYICDYCGEEIRLEKQWDNKSGGIIQVPTSITGIGSVTLALHNKCLQPVLDDFNSKYLKKE